VNFILDKKFTGFKADVSGGATTYGDDANYKVALTGGDSFAGGRGHFVLSGQVSQEGGVLEGDRAWNQLGWQVVNSPTYTSTNGQPQRLLLPRIGPATATPGGLIVSGPLKGVAFGQGGAPYMFNYGPLVSSSAMQGGAWQSSSLHLVGQSIEPKMSMQNVFGHITYDVTDNVEVYAQSSMYTNQNSSHAYPNEFFGGLTVQADNPFLPASVAAQAQALGLQTLLMGTSNADMGTVTIDTQRRVLRNILGADGKFDVLGKTWKWDAYFQGGISKSVEAAENSLNLAKHTQAVDAVRNPATGAIVCRSTLTNPNDGCVPYNPFGIGVNSAAALDYVLGRPNRDQTFKENVVAASVNGNPLSSWAGPISVAAGAEHRTESVSGWSTEADLAGQYFAGNYVPTFGKYSVTEEFLETVVPLASELPWAKALDLNAAVRFTDYSVSGAVTTWKAGATYRPIEDVMLRVTRSRDIRAPNLNDLFANSKVNNVVVDDANPTQAVAYEGTTKGNLNLKPEEADSTGVGIVYQPSYLHGFSASVDYWNIDLKDAINVITAQQVVDLCFEGNQSFCQAINGGQPLRDGSGAERNAITIQPFNLAEQLVRGIDFETSYRAPLSTFNSGWGGDLLLRALGTHFLKNYTNNTLTPPLDTAGENVVAGTPSWRWNASITYNNEPVSATFMARGVSAGVYGNNFIQCTAGCPASTIDNPTINDNHLAGAIYFDLSLGYTMQVGHGDDASLEMFLNIRNLANKDPVIVAGGPSGLPFDTVSTNPANYDSLGRVFTAGVRLKL
jgi:outer membrane receptor protein involved in Fe transport